MTNRKPKTVEQPATQPLLSESSTQRLTWIRQISDAEDEKSLIDIQRESVSRVNDAVRTEALAVYEATCATARKAADRALADGDAIMSQGIIALDQRTADLDKVIAGLQAALSATGEA